MDNSSGVGDDDGVRLLKDEHSEEQTKPLHLERKIGLLHAVAMVVGGSIGSGIFISPSFVLKNCHSVGLTLVVWMLGGAISIFGGLCYCEWATLIPKSGGTYVYLKFAYGDLVAFLYSWLDIWFTGPGYKSLMCISFAVYATEPFYLLIYGSKNAPDWVIKVVAASLLCIISILNLVSARVTLKAQAIFATTKLLAIVVIVGVGITRFVEGYTGNFQEPFKGSASSPGLLGHAFYSVMFAYSGWGELCSVTEEVRNPVKNFPRTILISMPIVTLCYVLLNVAYFSVLDKEEYLSSIAVVVTFGNKLNFTFGLIMPLVVALSCLGSINSEVFYSCRMLASVAMEKQIPSLFAFVHRKSQIPIPALIFRTVTSLILLPYGIETLLNWLLFIEWFISFAVFTALIMLRFTKPNLHRGYKVNIVIAVIMVLVSVYFSVVPFLTKPMEACYGLAVMASGIPVYYLFIVKKCIPQCLVICVSKISSWIQSFCNVEKPERKLESEETR